MSRTLALAFLAGAWLLGTAAAAATGAEPAAAVAAFGLLGALAFARRPGALTLALVLAGGLVILAATWRYEATVPTMPADSIARMNDGDEVIFRAVIDDEPLDRTTTRQYRLDVAKCT